MFLSLLGASFLRTKTLKRIQNTFYGEKFYGEKNLSLLGTKTAKYMLSIWGNETTYQKCVIYVFLSVSGAKTLKCMEKHPK